MNIAKIMIPKVLTAILHDTDSVRKGLEVMTYHGYTAIPVLDDQEKYIGCVTEGDLLRHVMASGITDKKYHEQYKIDSIIRKEFCPAVSIDADYKTVSEHILNQNFLPVVDGRGALCGILTRKNVIEDLITKIEELKNASKD